MKKLLPAASLFASMLLLAFFLRTSVPVHGAQGGEAGEGLDARVATLELELAAEKRRHDETRALLDQTLVYLEKQGKAAQALLTALDESEQQGFAVGENWRSRQTLLAGFRGFMGGVESGLPKVPVPEPPKPSAPVRRARQ